MNIVLFASDARYDQKLAPHLERGFVRNGDHVLRLDPSQLASVPDKTDLVAFVGVKSLEIKRWCEQSGVQSLLIDKGYFGRGEYFRMSLNGFQPSYLPTLIKMQMPSDRLAAAGVGRLRPKHDGNLVIYAASSQKFHNWHDAGDVGAYSQTICEHLVRIAGSRRRIIYRPKPSWWVKQSPAARRSYLPRGCELSHEKQLLADLLPSAQCLVTYGSNAAVEALIAGVPVIVPSIEGISAVHSIAEHELQNVLDPYWPSDEDRFRVINALAWCQFTEEEMASGFAWQTIKEQNFICVK